MRLFAVKRRAGKTRRMAFGDLHQVMRIERSCFSDPMSFNEVNALRLTNKCVVYTIGGVLVGYIIFHHSRWSTSLVSIAVDPGFRRLGIGSSLLAELDPYPMPRWALVREENLTAHLFFRDQGYKCCKVVKTPYDNCDSDGYLFVHE